MMEVMAARPKEKANEVTEEQSDVDKWMYSKSKMARSSCSHVGLSILEYTNCPSL
jgi:hypothetical protein